MNSLMTTNEINEDLTFSVRLSPVADADGFNEYGVREREDGSIDVVFNAMEPGLRQGSLGFDVRITEEFLQHVAGNFSNPVPLQLDHSRSQMANVGVVKEVRFASPFLRVLGHIPNTGSRLRSDVIADFTHEPPAITDGSAGFGDTYELIRNEDEELEFVDATLVEFSLTPFPAGYDNGGLSPSFAEAVRRAGIVDQPEPEHRIGTSRVRPRVFATFNEI